QQLSFATHGEPVRFLEEPGATDLGPRSAALRFVTDVAATSVVLFGPKGTPLDDALAIPGARTSHRLDLQGLSPGTAYQYQVYCTAPGRASALTSVRELRTLDLPAVISQISIQPAIRQAVVSYVTDVPIATRVEYGPSGSFGQSLSNPESVTYHLVTLTGLEPDTRYSLRVVAAEAGRVPATGSAPDFRTGDAVVHIVGGPDAVGLTASSALIRWTTDEPSDSLVEYGTRNPLEGRASSQDAATSHQMVLPDLSANTHYSFRVTSSTSGLQAAQSVVLSFTTPGAGTAAYLRGFPDLDVANDTTGGILDPLSDSYGATTGLMAGFAVDEARGLAYLARGPVTTEDGREPGLVGVACLQLSRPLDHSMNPASSAAKATSRFTDTGLIVPAIGAPSLRSVAAVAFDAVADRVYVLAESEGGILVLSAPGGSVGGAPGGGGVGAANEVLVQELMLPNDAGPSGSAIAGTVPRGLTTSTKDGMTTLYLSLGSHAEVWRGANGQWARQWSSIALPNLRPGPVAPGAVVAGAVDADGNSYWVVSGPQGGLWQYPAGLVGLAQGVVGAPTSDLRGPGRPVVLESDDTLIRRADLDQFGGVAYSHGMAGHTLWLSALGSSPGAGPALLRCRLPEDPYMAGSALVARLIDAFGSGALAPTDDVLASLRAPQPRDPDGTQYTQPAALAGDLLPVQAGSDGGGVWVEAYVKDALAGQVVPTGALLEVAVSPTVARPFYLVPPTQEKAGPTSMTLRFVTDLLVTSTVRYSVGGALDSQVTETAATSEHRVTLSGLKPATTYQVQVVAGGQGTVAAATQVLLYSTGRASLGDGNLNGRVDVGDAVLALRLALGMRQPTAQDLELLDVSPAGHPDGRIAMDDVVLVLRAALGLVTLG
ncbi:MAG TPA: fibronectin type III domain-containing protein, partial [Armatimonadota bacterium]